MLFSKGVFLSFVFFKTNSFFRFVKLEIRFTSASEDPKCILR